MGIAADIYESNREKFGDCYPSPYSEFSYTFSYAPSLHALLATENDIERDRVKLSDIDREFIEKLCKVPSNEYKSKSKFEGVQVLYDWRNEIEQQIIILIDLKKQISSPVAQMSFDCIVSEMERKRNLLNEKLSELKDFECFLKLKKTNYKRGYSEIRDCCESLFLYLLGYIRAMNRADDIGDIVKDLRVIVAFVLNKKDNSGKYKCSVNDYIEYLTHNSELLHDKGSCANCGRESLYLDCKYCLICGKRR